MSIITDRGNIRVPTDGIVLNPNYLPNVLNMHDYYPFGMLMPIRNLSADEYSYGYTGHEKDDEIKGEGNSYTTAYRFYDPRIARWQSVDPLAEKYPGYSSYCYVMNNPINAIDPDGRVVIFVNGQHAGDGGNSSYWNGLDNRIMNRLGDHHARYYDGAMGGFKNTGTTIFFAPTTFFTSLIKLNLFEGNRRRAGKEMGYNQASEIFGNLADGQTIKIASHSYGRSFSKGVIQGLNKYVKENGIDMKGKIEIEIDLAPFQPKSQSAQPGVPTTVIAHKGDTVAGSETMPDSNHNVTREDKESGISEHYVESFDQNEINLFVPQSQNNRPGKSKWEEKPQN